VTAVDFSREGLRKAARLAAEHRVTLELVEADLADYDLGTEHWAGIVSIFAHTPRDVRRRIHAAIPYALRPGGVLVLEAYRPEQLALGTGGPRDPALMPTLSDLRTELAGLDFEIARDADREIREGRYHAGPSATVQVLATRRA
jgi:SAM-dependent methyltransferase